MKGQVEFDEWVKSFFDREVTYPPNYGDDSRVTPLEEAVCIEYATRLLLDSAVLTSPYSDGQVNQGLYRLNSMIFPMMSACYCDAEVSAESRIAFLRSILHLNLSCFGVRCTPHLSHLDRQTPELVSPLNAICYIWWEDFLIPDNTDDPEEDLKNRVALNVMEQCLDIPHIAVQEGALHGLGHFQSYYPDECEAIVAAFLKKKFFVDPGLKIYAQSAMEGNVL